MMSPEPRLPNHPQSYRWWLRGRRLYRKIRSTYGRQLIVAKLARAIELRPHPLLWIVAGALLIAGITLSWMPKGLEQSLPRGMTTLDRALPSSPTLLMQTPAQQRKVYINAGESLDSLFERLSIPKWWRASLKQFRGSAGNKNFLGINNYLLKGRTMSASFADDGTLQYLDVDINRKQFARLHMVAPATITVEFWSKAERWVSRLGGGVINYSLFTTLDRSNIPDTVALQVADIWGTEIDFSKDLRKGDVITLVYRQLFIEGIAQPEAKVEAVWLVNRHKDYRAYRFNGAGMASLPEHIPAKLLIGASAASAKANHQEMESSFLSPEMTLKMFYNDDGQSVVKGFLRNPLEFSRVSSQFNLGRFHPILHTVRAHTGVDFAAPIGTPVRAVGDGFIRFVGDQNGYGKTVIIDHPNQVETRYAHLHDFASGLAKGQKVLQTQTIGYVGKSGLATGAHLHFEFRVAGRAHDPLTVALPRGEPIPANRLDEFMQVREALLGQLMLAKIYDQVPIE